MGGDASDDAKPSVDATGAGSHAKPSYDADGAKHDAKPCDDAKYDEYAVVVEVVAGCPICLHWQG